MPANKPLTIAAFHGFLGDGGDWDMLEKYVSIPLLKLSLTGNHTLPENTILLGYSMGGRAAFHHYFQQKENVKGICLLSSDLGTDDLSRRNARNEERNFWVSLLDSQGLDSFLSFWYSQPLFSSFQNSPSFQSVLERRKAKGIAAIKEELMRWSFDTCENYWEHLSAVKCPLYFLYGKLDAKYELLYKKCGNLKKSPVNNAGHAIHLENPRECAEKIQSFIHTCLQ